MDDHFDALADGQRRAVLVAMLEERRSAAGRPTARVERFGEEDADRTALRHTHLPKLENYGLIRWNRPGREITTGPTFDEIEPFLTLLADDGEGLAGASATE